MWIALVEHIKTSPYLTWHRAKTIGKEAIERSCDAFSVAVKAMSQSNPTRIQS
jgi:hypothetical protein